MIELFFRTVILCFLMEIGSASNFTIAAMANTSDKWVIVLIGGVIGLILAQLLAIKLCGLLDRLPISSNVVSGLIMIIVGSIFLFKDSA